MMCTLLCYFCLAFSAFARRFCYHGVLEACRLASPPQWKQACSTLAQMKADGVPPNAVCYKTAIQACRGASEDEEANSLMSEMIEAGFSPQEELIVHTPEGAPVPADVEAKGGAQPCHVVTENAS